MRNVHGQPGLAREVGNKMSTNESETEMIEAAAQERAQLMQERFGEWVWT